MAMNIQDLYAAFSKAQSSQSTPTGLPAGESADPTPDAAGQGGLTFPDEAIMTLAAQLGSGGAAANLASILSSFADSSGPGTGFDSRGLNAQAEAIRPFGKAGLEALLTQIAGGQLDNQAKAQQIQKARGPGMRGTTNFADTANQQWDERQARRIAQERAKADLQAAQMQPGRDKETYNLEIQSKKESLKAQNAALDNMLKEFELKKKTAELEQRLQEQHMRMQEAEHQRKSAYNDKAMGFAQQLMNAILGG